MAEFAYKNAKNASTDNTLFELNCDYNPYTSYEKDIDTRFQSQSLDKLAKKLQNIMTICKENLYHVQELKKCSYKKHAKSTSYAPGDKIWLNSNYFKTKENRISEAKICRLFCVLYLVDKQAYKIELFKK